MKIIYSYKNSSGEDQTLVRYSDVPRTGDIVRVTDFPDTVEHYIVTKVIWSINKDESLNPDVEITVFLVQRYKDWLGL